MYVVLAGMLAAKAIVMTVVLVNPVISTETADVLSNPPTIALVNVVPEPVTVKDDPDVDTVPVE